MASPRPTFAKVQRRRANGKTPWTEAEDQLVRDAVLSGRLPADLREQLPARSHSAVKARIVIVRQRLGLSQRQVNGWSKVQGTMLDPGDPGFADPSDRVKAAAVVNASAQLLAAINRAYPKGCPQ